MTKGSFAITLCAFVLGYILAEEVQVGSDSKAATRVMHIDSGAAHKTSTVVQDSAVPLATSSTHDPIASPAKQTPFIELMHECASLRNDWVKKNILSREHEPTEEEREPEHAKFEAASKELLATSEYWMGTTSFAVNNSTFSATMFATIGVSKEETVTDEQGMTTQRHTVACGQSEAYLRKDGQILRHAWFLSQCRPEATVDGNWETWGETIDDATMGPFFAALIMTIPQSGQGKLEYLVTDTEQWASTSFQWSPVDKESFEKSQLQLEEEAYSRRPASDGP